MDHPVYVCDRQALTASVAVEHGEGGYFAEDEAGLAVDEAEQVVALALARYAGCVRPCNCIEYVM